MPSGINRVMTLGELTASIALEINQPITAVVTEPAPPRAGWTRNRQT
jgi:C4-dicarboxylate-specific signal transduction histidine kinase